MSIINNQINNYLYLEDFYVTIFGQSQPIFIPGLKDIAQALYRNTDLDSYLASSKTHDPFTGKNISDNSGIKVSTFSEFVDILTTVIPYSTQTSGKQKLYAITLNPDNPENPENLRLSTEQQNSSER